MLQDGRLLDYLYSLRKTKCREAEPVVKMIFFQVLKTDYAQLKAAKKEKKNVSNFSFKLIKIWKLDI